VSVKLIHEICINKPSSNSRLTAVGRWATASDSHSQNWIQTLFLSLYLWWHNNRAIPACWKTYWNCIAFKLGTLCGVYFVLCCFSFALLFYPLMRQQQNYFWDTTSRTGDWGAKTKIIKNETLLHLNLEIFFHLFIFLFLFLFFFIFNFQSSLCLSNAYSAYSWLVLCLFLFISLKLFLFISLFVFSTYLFVYPFSFNFFAFHLLSPFHSKYD
jgi:hypothetical protein